MSKTHLVSRDQFLSLARWLMGPHGGECTQKNCFNCSLRKYLLEQQPQGETREFRALLEKAGKAYSAKSTEQPPYGKDSVEIMQASLEMAERMNYPAHARFYKLMLRFYSECDPLLEEMRIEEGRPKPIDAQDPTRN